MPELYTPYWQSRNRQTLYSINRINGMNMTQAALEAGYSPSSANIASVRNETKHLQNIKEALESTGVTNNRLAVVIQDALEANRAVIVDKSIEYVTDHKTRLDATKLALEAKGELKSGTTVAVQINLPAVAVNKDAWGEE